jgi:ABC-2 type transport system ATP-binding protein
LSTWIVAARTEGDERDLTLLARELRSVKAVETIVPFGTTLHISGHDRAALEKALAPVRARPGLTLTPVEPSLEDVFISLMQTTADNVQ